MAVHSDITLKHDDRIEIERPDGEVDYQPSSVDLHLDDTFGVYENTTDVVDVHDQRTYPHYEVIDGETVEIHPNAFILATTEETVRLANDVVGYLWGRSSVGRLGLFVHNAGLVDGGFEGQLTLELHNASANTIRLHSGMSIVQMTVHDHTKRPRRGYGQKENKYQSQRGPTPSKLYND